MKRVDGLFAGVANGALTRDVGEHARAPQFRQMAEAAANRGWTKPGGRASAKYDKGEQSDRLGNQEWRLGLGRRQRREGRNFLE